MVDKIDKPEPPPPYAIAGTTETKRDKPREERKQEDLPTFQQKNPSLYQEKFASETSVSKTIRVPLAQIERLLLKRATPRHGAPTAEADLVWKDGRVTENVSFLIHNWQDFLKIKNLKTGTTIPEEYWKHTPPHLEITIKQAQTSGPWNMRELQKSPQAKTALKWQKAFDTKFNIKKRILIGIGVILAIGFIIFLTRL